MIITLSTRKLSDPDLGFHLHGGKWITEHLDVPQKDIGTYTVVEHEYIDLHWGFQLFIYTLYKVSGYKGLSLAVLLLSLAMVFLILHRNFKDGIDPLISLLLLLIGFLIIEFRFVLRPELFSNLFLLLLISFLDEYYSGKRKHQLYVLPLIMLLWCNMHSLFILGHFVMGAYFTGIWIRDQKPDKSLLMWIIIAVLICLVNPYVWKALVFPFSLITRFETGNIFHQHIREFIPFFSQEKFYVKDYLFLIYTISCFTLFMATRKNRKFHEWLVLAGFLFLSVKAVRNLPLFVLVSLPVFAIALQEFLTGRRKSQFLISCEKKLHHWSAIIIIMTVIPLMIGLRVYTNAWYSGNNSYDKTGIGIDSCQQPVQVADYLLQKRLDGRIINSMPYGGFLSWKLPQPVFIDGRLEVIGESLYQEVENSWHGNLGQLISKYQPDLFVFCYRKYFPWTVQLLTMDDWRVIYLDGSATVFARNGYRDDIPSVDFGQLPDLYNLHYKTAEEKERILNQYIPGKFQTWVTGFWRKQDEKSTPYLNIASFCLQKQDHETAEQFFLENLRLAQGKTPISYYALADIYWSRGDIDKARICCKKILLFDPGNPFAKKVLHSAG